MSAAFFLFLGWQWLMRPDETARLFWTVTAFAISSLALFLGTQAQGLGASIFCDTVSPPHIWAILAAAAIMLPGLYWAPRQLALRALIMLAAASAAILIIALRAPECVYGAFGTLDPVVREYWYVHVNEGLPIWHQELGPAAIVLVGPVAGFFSSLYLINKATAEERPKRIMMGFFTSYGLILSLLVFRTVSVASAYAVLPAAMLIAHLFTRYRQEAVAARRVLFVALMLALVVPNTLVRTVGDFFPEKETAQATQSSKYAATCESASSIAALSALPTGQILAPFDIAPMILAQTEHSVLASSHHRNEQAMRDHIQMFRSSPEAAHQLLKSRGIDYLAVCTDEEELANYVRKDPDGLWAQMAKDKVPEWLAPLPAMGKGIKVWRVR